MIALDFQEPVNLSFLQFRTIPRVLFRLLGERDGHDYEGIGEASIDFPFVNYDLWDVFWCLSQLSLDGISYPNGYAGSSPSLPPLPFSVEQLKLLSSYPSALAALTMASDDLWGRAYGESLTAMTKAMPKGPTSWSIGFCETLDALRGEIWKAWNRDAVPKIKLGKSIRDDLEVCRYLGNLSFLDGGGNKKLSADFNGAYTMDELLHYLATLDEGVIDLFSFLEQPLKKDEDRQHYVHLPKLLQNRYNWGGALVADESVITQEDAVELAQMDWRINYKMQKIGGLRRGLLIQDRTNHTAGMVGGTLPTAVGRAYDLWAGASLSSCLLPSDAWMPSTEWFDGERHLIVEEFSVDAQNRALPFQGPGLGITPDWDKIKRHIIPDAKATYRAIRTDKQARYIDFRLRDGLSYYDCYRALAGADPLWNL